ncbi:MAG: flagellar basal body rod protein FlgB [Halopseudomonas sp.]
MAISFDAAFGIHQQALLVRTQRAEVLAGNIVNADTPNYKARDIDFRGILNGTLDQQASQLGMKATSSSHQSGVIDPDFAAEMMYRTPLQPSLDGNTVDVQQEQAEYAKNALAFQASYTFLNKKMTGMMAAIKGE